VPTTSLQQGPQSIIGICRSCAMPPSVQPVQAQARAGHAQRRSALPPHASEPCRLRHAARTAARRCSLLASCGDHRPAQAHLRTQASPQPGPAAEAPRRAGPAIRLACQSRSAPPGPAAGAHHAVVEHVRLASPPELARVSEGADGVAAGHLAPLAHQVHLRPSAPASHTACERGAPQPLATAARAGSPSR